MKKRNLQRIFAAFMATAMAMSAAACSSEKPVEDTSKKADTSSTTTTTTTTDTKAADTTTTAAADVVEEDPTADLLKDKNGNVVDLGGIEVIVRDWWSDGNTSRRNDYEDAREDYREEMMETYNFSIKSLSISDWGSVPTDFADYATTGGDEYYVFTLDSRSSSAASQGLMYDLATLDCLDFNDQKFQLNKTHELFSIGNSIYACSTGVSEPRTGIFFNKRLLKEAGIDPESIYDMQANNTWTWAAWENLLDRVQRDTNNDGVIDVWGFAINESVMTEQAIYSNGSEMVGLENGKYVYKLQDAATVEALEWCNNLYAKYDEPTPADAAWDYYKEQIVNGECAFFIDQAYCGVGSGLLLDSPDEWGFVMFPIGPSCNGTYVNCWTNNIFAIPSCYDADKAWKVAFAYNLYTNEPAGYEDYVDLGNYRAGIYDERAVNETIYAMMQPEHGMVTYHSLIAGIEVGPDFMWSIGGTAVVSELLDAIAETWKSYINAANGQ